MALLDKLSQIIEEDLTPGVMDSLPALSELWNKMNTTWMGVTRDHIGRTYKVIHTFAESLSGGIHWVPVTGETVLSTVLHTEMVESTIESDAGYKFPGIDDVAMTGFVQKSVTLSKAMGNILVPHEWLRAGKLTAAIADGAALILKGAAQNVALADIHAFFSMNTTTGSQGAIALAAETTAGGATTATFAVKSGSIRSLYPGLHVDIYRGGAILTSQAACGNLVVNKVRYVPDETNDSGGYGEVTLVNRTGTNITAVAVGDALHRAKSADGSGNSYAPIGPETWLDTSGSPFGVSLINYQQFISILKDVSGVLTEQVLNRYFGRFFQAYGMRDMPDTIVTSMGVTNSHVENSDGLGRFDRTGKTFMITDGWEFGAVPYIFNGMKMTWHVDAFMPSISDITAASQTGGRLWGLKFRDGNIMRYVPPQTSQGRSQEPFGSEVEFIYPQIDSIFKPYHSSDGKSTTLQEAPFYRYVAYMPRVIPGVKLFNLAESI